MTDRYDNYAPSLESPALHAFSIAPSDTADMEEVTRAVYIGQAGDIHAVLASGASVTFKNLPSGATLAIRARRILQAGTTATAIVGLT